MMRSLAFLFVIFIASPGAVFAAEVTKVKGKSVLVDLKGDSAAPGDTFYGIKANGKRGAIIKIVKVKGEKAIGKVSKGKADTGMKLEFKPAKTKVAAKNEEAAEDDGAAETPATSGRSFWGGQAGLTMDKMTAKIDDASSTSMSGMGFSAKGLFDYELFPRVWFRGTTGIESFNVSSGDYCTSGAACNAKLMYLSFDFIGRYVFSEGKVRPWLGGGVGLLFPVTKSASALDSASISTTNVMVITGGVDWYLNPKMYVPISVEMGILPKSDQVEASWIGIRAGIAVPFN